MSIFSIIYMGFLKYTNPKKYALKLGVKVGKNCRLLSPLSFGTEPYLIEIGNHVSISGGGTFITHEGAHWVLKGLDNEKYKDTFGYGRIVIHDNVYIGAKVTILRGVTIGENTVVGACSLVNKRLEPNSVYAGVPAKRICSIAEWEAKFMADMPEFDLQNYKTNKKEEVLKIVDKFQKR